eukprot:5762812-Pleurochrysis_carterae.AAC.1
MDALAHVSTGGLVPSEFRYIHGLRSAEWHIRTAHLDVASGQLHMSLPIVTLNRAVCARRRRCIELDCFDGAEGEPEIYHRNTLTTKISLRSVLVAIKDVGFETTPYPVILSLEMHCGIDQQVGARPTIQRLTFCTAVLRKR